MILLASHSSFAFQAQELPQKLSQASLGMLTGYWQCEFPVSHSPNRTHSWYLALSRKRIIFSGTQPLAKQALLEVFQRYVPRLRSDDAKRIISNLQQPSILEQQETHPFLLLNLLNELHRLHLITYQEMEQALRLKILSDFDKYLFDHPGQAEFLPSPQLRMQIPMARFEIENLLSEAIKRQACWKKLKEQIPSMDSSFVLTMKAVESQDLTVEQKQRLEFLVSSGKTLSDIAFALAQDELEIAKVFAKLISNGLVKLQALSAVPEIFVIDDSPILLKQLESLMTGWGYVVRTFGHPAGAMQRMFSSNPAAIFIDINMPSISGFDLVKQIRRRPELASVPLIMLTAEKTLSNNWRARWSGCHFLTKPLTVNEVPSFQLELRKLLLELVKFQKQNQFVSSSNDSSKDSFEESCCWGTV
ncbi:MAG: response regulator [Scytonema sp. RU_4_4]|nr:response regulator [Scytonema sp. RU_4_4]NJR72568.1 response regulator [Scytonema sp. CRU_2_7]